MQVDCCFPVFELAEWEVWFGVVWQLEAELILPVGHFFLVAEDEWILFVAAPGC